MRLLAMLLKRPPKAPPFLPPPPATPAPLTPEHFQEIDRRELQQELRTMRLNAEARALQRLGRSYDH